MQVPALHALRTHIDHPVAAGRRDRDRVLVVGEAASESRAKPGPEIESVDLAQPEMMRIPVARVEETAAIARE